MNDTVVVRFFKLDYCLKGKVHFDLDIGHILLGGSDEEKGKRTSTQCSIEVILK